MWSSRLWTRGQYRLVSKAVMKEKTWANLVVVNRGEFFPQIAGSYTGSYFSMARFLISEIAKWSWCRCRLVSQACLPSWFPFWAALGCRFRLVSQACLPSWSLLGCSWLPLPPCLPPCFASWFPFWAALGCCCRLVSLPSGFPCLLFKNALCLLSGVYAGVFFLCATWFLLVCRAVFQLPFCNEVSGKWRCVCWKRWWEGTSAIWSASTVSRHNLCWRSSSPWLLGDWHEKPDTRWRMEQR